MTRLLITVLNMSLTASFVIAGVLAVRLLLRRVPKIYSYLLWAAVLFRLLCPVSFSFALAPLSLASPEVVAPGEGVSYVTYLPETSMEIYPEQLPPHPVAQQETYGIPAAQIGAGLWLAGVGVLAMYSAVLFFRVHKSLVGAVPVEKGVVLADHIESAFVIGFLRPVICLPSGLSIRERELILAHERHHIRRCDHIMKLLAWIALCIHWFNPLVWLAFFLAGKDMEMSCDEAVIRRLGSHVRGDYAQALLRLAMRERVVSFAPLAFGEGDTKGRVINMSKWKKPKFWTSLICAVICVCILVACAANPEGGGVQAEPASSVVGMGSISIALTQPFTHEQSQRGGVAFLRDGEIVGGLEYYSLTEELGEDPSPSEVAEAIGLPDTQLEYPAYMGGSTVYGDMEINYFDELSPESWNRMHHFYLLDDGVYDLWFDENLLPFDDRLPILTGIMILVAEPALSQPIRVVPADQEDLEKCRQVLQTIQSSDACWIKTEKSNEGENVLNETTTSRYFASGDDWMLFHEIPEQGIVDGEPVWFSCFAYMFVDGVRYDNMEDSSLDEFMNVHWNVGTEQEVTPPWLTFYRWNSDEVQYITTLPDGSGEAVILLIDAPYLDTGNSFDEYYVTFHFDKTGAFRYVEVQASLLLEDDSEYTFTARETIVSLENSVVEEEIHRQHRLALGGATVK